MIEKNKKESTSSQTRNLIKKEVTTSKDEQSPTMDIHDSVEDDATMENRDFHEEEMRQAADLKTSMEGCDSPAEGEGGEVHGSRENPVGDPVEILEKSELKGIPEKSDEEDGREVKASAGENGSRRKRRSGGKKRGDEKKSDQEEKESFPNVLPVLPLRGGVAFNSMIIPLVESRENFIAMIEQASHSIPYMFLTVQNKDSEDTPRPDELQAVGMVVRILKAVRVNDEQVKVLAQGVSRAKAEIRESEDPPLLASVSALEDVEDKHSPEEKEALMRIARELSDRILHFRNVPSEEIMNLLSSVEEPGKLADVIAANMRMGVQEAQGILECLEPCERLAKVNAFLLREAEIAELQAKIQHETREHMEKFQKEFFLREQIKVIHKELGDADAESEVERLRNAVEHAGMPEEARQEAEKQLSRLAVTHGDSPETQVIHSYLDFITELPWKKCTRDKLNISAASAILDEDHYGLEKVKERILEFLSVRKLNANTRGPVLCFVGPPGVGKTSLGRSIARAMGRKFQRISLGGMRDEAEIRGHRRTYVGALPGRILQAVRQAGTRNPVIMLDEIDKLGSDFRGDPASALLEALDPAQNSHFSDHYLNLEYDLSKVLFLCTANQTDTIPAPLLDRMEVISISGYTLQEKMAIAQSHLIGRQIEENGLTLKDAVFKDEALHVLIRQYTREAGVRNLEREIGSVCRKLARKKVEGSKGTVPVTPDLIKELLGPARFLEDEREEELLPGVALGLAWTAAGGEVLHVEVGVLPGKGNLLLTGQLGDVMKESAQAALSYVRSRASVYGVAPEFFQEHDFHVHVPAGATPKDGPSAGVTLVSALLSASTGKALRGDTCMTGEITLRGRVLPVGGIKEKILGAVTRGLKRVVIPAQNARDLEEIPENFRQGIKIFTVTTADELLSLVLSEANDTLENGKGKVDSQSVLSETNNTPA